MNDLPYVPSPEEAKRLLINSHASFIDSVAKFVTLGQYYQDASNTHRPLTVLFQANFAKNNQALLNAPVKDVIYSMAQFSALTISYILDVKENLEDYEEILKGQDASLSDYDKACDLLAIKDTFTDLEKGLNLTNKYIATDREIQMHPGNAAYDPQLNQAELEA